MEWTDEGIVLSARRHGESATILSMLTAEHGRHAGLVRGGSKARGSWQPGNRLSLVWRARLEEHLGNFIGELLGAPVAALLDDPARLAALSAACAIADRALPEREPCPELFERFALLLDGLDTDDWALGYVLWELSLLGALGFGLDLSCCAATGRNDQLAYVSPRSGRAVSLSAGEPYKDKLLPLPGFLIGEEAPHAEALADALTLTGYFLNRNVFALYDRPLPDSRLRLADRIRAGAGTE